MKRRPDGVASDFFADMIKKSGAKRAFSASIALSPTTVAL
jgi:hypothetical protein